MVLNVFDSRQLQPPNSENWTKGPTSLSSLLKNDDQGVWRWYSTQWEDQGHQICLDAEWFTSCSIQVVAISSLVKSAPFLANFVWLTSRHLRLTLFNRLTVRCGTSTVTVRDFTDAIRPSFDLHNAFAPWSNLAFTPVPTKVKHTPCLLCLDGARFQPSKCDLSYYDGKVLFLMCCDCYKTVFSRMSSEVGTWCLSVVNLSSAGLTPGSLHGRARSLSTIQVKPVHL